jgi:hypothetical protein
MMASLKQKQDKFLAVVTKLVAINVEQIVGVW